MIDLTRCQGAPVIISHPHFLEAEQEVQDAITGFSIYEPINNFNFKGVLMSK